MEHVSRETLKRFLFHVERSITLSRPALFMNKKAH